MQYTDLGVVPYKKSSKKKKIIKFGLLTLFLGMVIYVGYLFYRPLAALLNQLITHPGFVRSFIRNPAGKLESSDGRTNILLLGIDKRKAVPYKYVDGEGREHENGFLSDTIIVISVAQDTKDVAMISIPRDTWVDISGWGNHSPSQGKINSVYSVGNIYSYPENGGLGLAKRTISGILGIRIHYAARVDFEGFRKIIAILE